MCGQYLAVFRQLIRCQPGQLPPAVERRPYQPGDDAVRLAERNAELHQQVGHISRGDQLVRGGRAQALALET